MGLRRTVHVALRRFGWDLVRYDSTWFPELRRPGLLRERQIDLVLDGGANAGHYAESLRQAGFQGRIVSFEPLSAARRELEQRAAGDSRWETSPFALGEGRGTFSLHIAGNSSSSSLLPMLARHVTAAPESAYVQDEAVEVRSLDELAPELVRAGERVWLKLDLQGYELPALRGAEQTLAQAEVVECEVSLVELYEGQALLPELYAHLAARGFGLWLAEPIFRDATNGEILQLDAVFVRLR